jgi:hypothetical protein
LIFPIADAMARRWLVVDLALSTRTGTADE